MTVIVYRDDIMAADSGVWGGSGNGAIIAGTTKKVRRLQHGRFLGGLFGAAGMSPYIDAVREWVEGIGPQPEPLEEVEFGALVIAPEGTVYRVSYKLEIYESCESPFHAEGGAGDFVLGALYMGATAEQAVKLAIDYTDAAFGPVQWERL